MAARVRPQIAWLDEVGSKDVALVGGKNASLGEMVRELRRMRIRTPDGFAVTAAAYQRFLKANGLDQEIRERLRVKGHEERVAAAGALQRAFKRASLPEELEESVLEAYRELSRRYGGEHVDVAVRSSATAEDLPDASFAGQQETFLNVRGGEPVLKAIKDCFASLFSERAISYREQNGFDHLEVALSVGVQKMVRADRAGAGVMFTIDPETGFPRVVVIEAVWGLGESLVGGQVNPDAYTVFKPLLEERRMRPILSKEVGDKAAKIVYAADGGTRTVETKPAERRGYVLTDDEILQLARWAVEIERHYDRPMDIEWAKDGDSGDLFIVQARPETVQSRAAANALRSYELKSSGEVLLTGLSVGGAIAGGTAIRIKRPSETSRFEDGAILVTEMTNPDWVPLMRRAAAIVTDRGGRTAHAAIVSRELGIPAVVGTGDATTVLARPREVTVSCAEGDEGKVYDGILEFEEREVDLGRLPEPRTRIMMNIATPAGALRWWRLPAQGIGLARVEFIVNDHVQVHPMALVHFDQLQDAEAKRQIRELTAGYEQRTDYFVDRLAQGIARIAASQHPHPVIVRTSDFKTNEYADLIGGRQFEPEEANPMLGFRGASRYYSDRYREGFALECRALRRVREEIGLTNVRVMLPFVRTVEEADHVLKVMGENGLRRGKAGLEVYMMCEIPSNVVLADQFAGRFDGFSIGSNDLTQLVLGIDRDSSELAPLFDERNQAIKRTIRSLIEQAHAKGVPVGICGQAPSDHPDFAAFLVECGIDSISLNPDNVVEAIRIVARAERDLKRR
ncbi:MAG TPA: phosphoenolpyruvate synthase [Candidatus Dormibacteraeota bacterium]